MKKTSSKKSGSILDLKDFLDEKTDLYNRASFIDSDPIQIPHRFSKKEDIEISAFFTATIAWGKRISIINNADKLMRIMNEEPFDFVMHASKKQLDSAGKFVHRTLNGEDTVQLILALRKIYAKQKGLEAVFSKGKTTFDRINTVHAVFESHFTNTRTLKHISSPQKGSAAKRLNMFLRWMVRNDNRGVDFGLWKEIQPKDLFCPLDVHSGNVARRLGLLKRNQNDWQAAEELTKSLIKLDAKDPVKYDFALFGLGVFEKF